VPCFDGRVRELLWLELGFFLRSDLRRLLLLDLQIARPGRPGSPGL
jgi:hypothetical protein